MIRMRRNRKNIGVRDLVSEVNLSIKDLIWPIFITEGAGIEEEIASMPNVYRYSIDIMIERIKYAKNLGIRAVALFPNLDISLKSEDAKEAYNENNLICRAIKEIKKSVDIVIIADVALDPYTTHGHDGIIENGDVENDKTIEILIKQSLVQAKAGCDIIAPSDMMDGRVGAIRKALDEHGYLGVSILSYAIKFSSNFYGPFRDAVGSKRKDISISKATYQMDYRNRKEAVKQAALDIEEGADIVMVKPGMPYLDIVKNISDIIDTPLFVYQVSGEYTMLSLLSEKTGVNFNEIMYESLIAFKRAGADAIFTYAALEIAKYLRNDFKDIKNV